MIVVFVTFCRFLGGVGRLQAFAQCCNGLESAAIVLVVDAQETKAGKIKYNFLLLPTFVMFVKTNKPYNELKIVFSIFFLL